MTTDPFERAVFREQIQDESRKLHMNRTGLTIHATVYVTVNVLLVVVWALTWTKFPWFVFPILGWGIGLAAHAAAYYSQRSSFRRLEAQLRATE